MFRLLGLLVLLTAAFGLGYYAGQHGGGDLRAAAVQLSRDAFDTALGMGLERNLHWRTELIEAKARVVDAKSELMERNYGSASRDLAKALAAVRAAGRAERDDRRRDAADALAAKLSDTRIRMSAGKVVPRSELDQIQNELDALLAR